MKSPYQYSHNPDGSIGIVGLPNIQVLTVAEQGCVRGRDWQTELSLPTYAEEWEQMAEVVGMSNRGLRFIVMDQSPSRLPGHPRLNPKTIVLPAQCPLELGHTGFVIGFVYRFTTAFDDVRDLVPSLFNVEVPLDLIEGDYVIAEAVLFDSPLADAAWEGLQLGIFSHTCAMTFMADGVESLVQVTLTCGDFPGCPGARILKTWEG